MNNKEKLLRNYIRQTAKEFILKEGTVMRDSQLREKLSKLVELMTKKYLGEINQMKKENDNPLNEYGREIATELIRDAIDDFLTQNEMLIDELYGDVPLEEFKKRWMKIAEPFENKFTNILNNMSTR